MPSPKAVLADIHDLKLDPTKSHNSTKKSGRLHDSEKRNVVATSTESIEIMEVLKTTTSESTVVEDVVVPEFRKNKKLKKIEETELEPSND